MISLREVLDTEAALRVEKARVARWYETRNVALGGLLSAGRIVQEAITDSEFVATKLHGPL